VRIGIDYRAALWNRAGIARYVRELTRALAARDRENRYELYAHFWRRDAVPPLELPANFTLHRARIPGKLVRWLERYAGRTVESVLGELDVFHFTDYLYPRVGRARRVITIYDLSFEIDESFHGPQDSRKLSARVRAILPGITRFIAISEATRRDLVRRYGIADDRILVAYPGIDHAERAPFTEIDALRTRCDLPNEYLLTVGTLEPRKNHLRLLEALDRLKDAPPLIVAGARGWLDDEVVAAMTGRGVQVRYLGSVTEPDLWGLVRGARALVYPSLYEGFGLPVLESMALGVPVVTSERPALTEVSGGFARLVEPTDVESIAAGIDRALQTPEPGFLEMARSWSRRFTWDRCARSVLRVYEEACAVPKHAG